MGGSLKLSPVILETRRTHYQSPALRNHRFVADGHSRIPCAKPLYALVDLIGTADGVRLLLDAPPPPACSVPSSAAQTATAPETATEEVDLKPFMEGWCRMRHGRLVEVSEDGLTGRYLTGSSYELHGGLMGDGPLRSFEMGAPFVAYLLRP
eukprot:g31159.t1